MICPNCHTHNIDNTFFCCHCGYKFPQPDRRNINKTADKLSIVSFILTISNVGWNILLAILFAIADSLLSNKLFGTASFYGMNYISYFMMLVSFPMLILAIVFSFIATAKKTSKRKFAIASRIICFSEIGIFILACILFVVFLILFAANGPYY